MIYRKLCFGINAIIGYIYKFAIDLHLLSIPNLRNMDNDIVVSLTSYGRRVRTNVVYYTLVSLLRQKIQPDKIVLWLAEDEWNNELLPSRLKKLKAKGVEICYCKDLKSYKKLIPTLRKYPNSTIITVDDDMIYSKDTIQTLVEEHLKYPREIICTEARKPIIKNGIPQNYNEWDDNQLVPFEDGFSSLLLFPVGVGGVLYPVNSLHNDVTNMELFMKFCPFADDIWFWFCGLRNNTIKRFVIKKERDLSFDNLYQYFHKGSALTHTNNFKHQNDEQLKNLFAYYNYQIENVKGE